MGLTVLVGADGNGRCGGALAALGLGRQPEEVDVVGLQVHQLVRLRHR